MATKCNNEILLPVVLNCFAMRYFAINFWLLLLLAWDSIQSLLAAHFSSSENYLLTSSNFTDHESNLLLFYYSLTACQILCSKTVTSCMSFNLTFALFDRHSWYSYWNHRQQQNTKKCKKCSKLERHWIFSILFARIQKKMKKSIIWFVLEKFYIFIFFYFFLVYE